MGGGRRAGVCALVWALVAASSFSACSDDWGSRAPSAADLDGGKAEDASFDSPRDLPIGDFPVDLLNHPDQIADAKETDGPDFGVGDAEQTPDSAVIVDGPIPIDTRLRPDVANAPDELRGSPLVTDPGNGPAREAAGYYRIAFEAFTPGLSFPQRPRTVVDFYFASTLEIWSTGLGGRLRASENASGQALVFRLPFGDELELVLDTARLPPHDFLQAYLRERGQTRQAAGEGAFPFPGVVNRIADPPFRGGPSEAPTTALLPPLFAFAQRAGSGTTLLTCTSSTLPLGDAGAPIDNVSPVWRSGGLYRLEVRADGSLTLTSETVALIHRFDERYDTHTWPKTGITTARLRDQIRFSETTIGFDQSKGGIQEIIHTVTTPGQFATYVFSRK